MNGQKMDSIYNSFTIHLKSKRSEKGQRYFVPFWYFFSLKLLHFVCIFLGMILISCKEFNCIT